MCRPPNEGPSAKAIMSDDKQRLIPRTFRFIVARSAWVIAAWVILHASANRDGEPPSATHANSSLPASATIPSAQLASARLGP